MWHPSLPQGVGKDMVVRLVGQWHQAPSCKAAQPGGISTVLGQMRPAQGPSGWAHLWPQSSRRWGVWAQVWREGNC